MSKIYLFVLLFFSVLINVHAQNISVTATAGTGSGSYSTLKAAFDAINGGTHQGTITINVDANTTETTTAILNASGGSSSYASVTIRPTTEVTISGNLAAALIELRGAQNVIIDGRIGGSGTTRSLTIQNTSTSGVQGTSTIRFSNDAANNTIQYVNIEGSSKSTNTATIIFLSSSGTVGMQNITINNNDIRPAGSNLPYVAIYSEGFSGTAMNANITINANLIHDYFTDITGSTNGISCTASNTGWTISGNSFYQTGMRSAAIISTHVGVSITSGENHTISNNFFGGSSVGAGGSPTTINAGSQRHHYRGISLNVGSAVASNIDGNVITNINITGTATNFTVFTGIRINTGKVNIGVNTPNIIGAAAGTGALSFNMANSNTTTSCFYQGIYSNATAGDLKIHNNIIGSITVTDNNVGGHIVRALEFSGVPTLEIQNNTLGGASTGSIQVNTNKTSMQGVYITTNKNSSYTITNNTIRNWQSGATSTANASVYGIYNYLSANNIVVTTAITGNTITNLQNLSTTSVSYMPGISVEQADAATASRINATISNNTISNLSNASRGVGSSVVGILTYSYFNTMSISNNTIHTLTSSGDYVAASGNDGAAQGISVYKAETGALTVRSNLIYNIEGNSNVRATHVSGIGVNYGGTNALIEKNRIYDLRNPYTPVGGLVSGIWLRGSSSTGVFTTANNMISLAPSNCQTYGIYNDATAAGLRSYYNTVYIAGTASGTENSGSLYRSGASNSTIMELLNNILYNVRSGGGTHYALLNDHTTPATGWDGTASNYNTLYSSIASTIARWGAASLSLTDFKVASAGDANSNSITIQFVDPAVGNLLLDAGSLGDNRLAGIPISITDDINGVPRSATYPYKGSGESIMFPLPVSLLYFNGVQSGNTHMLTWRAACANSVRFIVERSHNGMHFSEIGHKDLLKTECDKPYTFTDFDILNSKNYYRLKMIESSGKVSYSSIVVLVSKEPTLEIIAIQPVLVDGGFTSLKVSAIQSTVIQISITNSEGKVLQTKAYKVTAGTNNLNLDVASLPQGTYFISGSTNDYIKTFRIIKQ